MCIFSRKISGIIDFSIGGFIGVFTGGIIGYRINRDLSVIINALVGMIIGEFIVYLIGIGSGAIGIILSIIGAAVGYISAEFLPSWWDIKSFGMEDIYGLYRLLYRNTCSVLLLWAIRSRSS